MNYKERLEINDPEDHEEIKQEYIKETAAYIVCQALNGLQHGGNLLLDRTIQRLNSELHSCPVTREEVRQAFYDLARSIEYGIEIVEGF